MYAPNAANTAQPPNATAKSRNVWAVSKSIQPTMKIAPRSSVHSKNNIIRKHNDPGYFDEQPKYAQETIKETVKYIVMTGRFTL
jgi:hypothetical protein